LHTTLEEEKTRLVFSFEWQELIIHKLTVSVPIRWGSEKPHINTVCKMFNTGLEATSCL